MTDDNSIRGTTEPQVAKPPDHIVRPSTPRTRRGSDVLLALGRGFWLILLGMVLCAGIASLATQLMSPVYRSEVYLLVVPSADDPPTDTATSASYAQTYSQLATAPEVVGEAVEDARVGVDRGEIEEVVNTEVSTDSPMFKVITSAPDPEEASELANAIGARLESVTDAMSENTGYRSDIVGRAEPAQRPAWPNLAVNLAVGTGVGFLLGVIAALAWDERRRAYGK